jgi:hypothetical protein
MQLLTTIDAIGYVFLAGYYLAKAARLFLS